MQSKNYFYLFLALICVLAGCNGKSDGKTPVTVKDSPDMNRQARDISLPGGFSSQTSLTFDSTAILAFLKKWPGFKSYENRIRKFYSARKYAYAWYDQDGAREDLLAGAGLAQEQDVDVGSGAALHQVQRLPEARAVAHQQRLAGLLLRLHRPDRRAVGLDVSRADHDNAVTRGG